MANADLSSTLPQQMISVYGDGVDASYKQHKENGVKIVDDLKIQPYGLKQFVLEDINGYLLRFGEEHEP